MGSYLEKRAMMVDLACWRTLPAVASGGGSKYSKKPTSSEHFDDPVFKVHVRGDVMTDTIGVEGVATETCRESIALALWGFASCCSLWWFRLLLLDHGNGLNFSWVDMAGRKALRFHTCSLRQFIDTPLVKPCRYHILPSTLHQGSSRWQVKSSHSSSSGLSSLIEVHGMLWQHRGIRDMGHLGSLNS